MKSAADTACIARSVSPSSTIESKTPKNGEWANPEACELAADGAPPCSVIFSGNSDTRHHWVPIALEFRPVNLRPRLDQPLLGTREAAAEAFNRVECVDRRLFVVVRMEMRPVMRTTGLDEHPNHDAKIGRAQALMQSPPFAGLTLELTGK